MHSYIKMIILTIIIAITVLGYYRIVVRKVITAEINDVYIRKLTDEDIRKIEEKYENSCGTAKLGSSIIAENSDDYRFITYSIIVTNNSNDRKANVLNIEPDISDYFNKYYICSEIEKFNGQMDPLQNQIFDKNILVKTNGLPDDKLIEISKKESISISGTTGNSLLDIGYNFIKARYQRQ